MFEYPFGPARSRRPSLQWGRSLIIALALTLPALLPADAQTTFRGAGRDDIDNTRQETLAPDEPSISDILAAHADDLRVVNGRPAAAGRWPSMVAIFLKTPSRPALNFCGGTAVGHNTVLTAAHCAAAMKRQPAGTSFFVREGTIDLNAKAHHDVQVANIIIDEDFDPHLVLNDVALLRLTGDLTAPRQTLISHGKAAELLPKDPTATIVGFGLMQEGGSASAQLREVELPVVDPKTCQDVYGSKLITQTNFCAGLKDGGKDACQGDSGGPLFVASTAGQPLQAGIVSWGKGCARAGLYGVYASVGALEDWIKAHVPDATFDDAPAPAPPITPRPPVMPLKSRARIVLTIAEGDRIKVGDHIRIDVTSSIDGSVVVFNQDPEGHTVQVYPSKTFPAPEQNPKFAHIAAGKTLSIPSAAQQAMGLRFVMDPPTGLNHLWAVVVPDSQGVRQRVSRNVEGEEIRDLQVELDALTSLNDSQSGNPDCGLTEKDYEIFR